MYKLIKQFFCKHDYVDTSGMDDMKSDDDGSLYAFSRISTCSKCGKEEMIWSDIQM